MQPCVQPCVRKAAEALKRAVSVAVRGSLVVSALRAAVAAVVERHAVLRTTYKLGAKGEFVQCVHAAPEGTKVLRELTAPNDAAAEALAAEEASRGFELIGEDGGVLRCTLIRFGA